MENEFNSNFDLIALLKIDNLDIRETAKNNPSLQIGEYFNMLEKIIENADDFSAALKDISDERVNENAFQIMADMKTMMINFNIGCGNFIPVIDEIIKFGKRGHINTILERAMELRSNFSILFMRLIAAKKQDPIDETQYTKGTQLLSKVIHLLDHEESTRKMKVLAVDDAPTVINTISGILENDYQVFGLTNPAMMENFLQQITPELFLLDYEMPELNGFDLVPVIRGFNDHKDTPIIFLTSKGTIDHVSAAYALGACDFIVKPFQDTILLEKVAKHIVRKKSF